jgi:acyl dehydratase
MPPSMAKLEMGRFLHAEHSIEIHSPLAPQGEGFMCNRVIAVEDRGRSAIIRNAALLYADAEQTQLIAQSCSGIYVRDGGGFEKERVSAPTHFAPEGPPDVTIVSETRPEQALLYRLSGDRHRLHSDPEFARQWGFERPILHGLCTLGIASRALCATLAGNDPDRISELFVRMVRPVLPGQTLTTAIWLDNNHARFQTVNDLDEIVLDRGTATVRAPT